MAARQALNQFDLSPIDFQKIAVQGNFPATQLLAAADTKDVGWLIMWSDYSPPFSLHKKRLGFRKVDLVAKSANPA